MTGKVYSNACVIVNGVNLSTDADTVTVPAELDKVDVTTFGSANKVYAAGLGDASITVSFFTDWRSGGPNDTLKTMFANTRSGTAGTVEIIPAGSPASATNPRLTMVSNLFTYNYIDASVSDASKFDAEFSNAGTAGITVGTA